MKILVLATETPLPPTSGSRLRTLHLSRQLARAEEVEVLALGPVPDGAEEPFPLRGIGRHRGRAAALALGLAKPYMAAKMSSRTLAEVAVSAGPDTVQAEFPYLVPTAAQAGVPVVLGAHNVESEVMRSLAETESRPLHRLRWGWEARKTARFERNAAAHAAAVCVPSDHDAEVFERWGARRVVVVPNGVDTSAIDHRPPASGATLLYIGHYGHRPNVLAARELATEVLPRIPNASVRLVGREAGADVRALAGPAVTVSGEVENTVGAFHAGRALVVPLRAGGGTRLKVLEALAAGTPVVSTRFGVAGLDVEDGVHVLVGETPGELAELARQVIENDALAASLSERGRRLVEARYDWSIVARPLLDVHRELAER